MQARHFIFLISVLSSTIVFAQKNANDTIPPVASLPGLFADPSITEFGGKYYIYPTTDGTTGWMSTYFTCWSSDDLVKWKNEGTILDLAKDVPWGTVRAWAPCAVKQKGKYYFYFSAAQSIGVAVSDKPTGPFKDALGKPLVEKGEYQCQSIDPMVFIDNDGATYLYFGQGKCMMVKLNDDMISFKKEEIRNITPKGYNEGSFVIKRNNKYYLMWSEFDTRDPRYSVAYAIADSPYGPFVRPEINPILKQKGIVKGAGHHSVVQVPGKDEWYIAYHRFKIPDGNGYNRETCIAPMRFDANGYIIPVDVFETMQPVKKAGK